METEKRTPLYIGIIVLIIILAIVSFYQRSVGDPYVSHNTPEIELSDDTDGDGLKNWEEVLWKTNAQNPDTDGDGTNDGEEILLGRDPLLKGPNDYLGGIVFDGSNTSSVAVNLLGSYVESSQSDEKKSVQEVVERALPDEINKPHVIQYAHSDLLLRGNNPEDYREYGNSFAQLFSYFENSPDEIKVFSIAMESGNPDDLLALNEIMGTYQTFLANLLLLRVPQEASEAHLSTINATSAVVADIAGMKLLFTDTLVAMDSFGNYHTSSQKVRAALSQIIEKIRTSGAQYSTDEIGYGLVNVL